MGGKTLWLLGLSVHWRWEKCWDWAGALSRDFHPDELRGFRYARREVLGGKAVALAVEAGGAYAGYLIHGKPDRHGLLRIAYLADCARARGQHIGEQALTLLRRRYPHSAIYFEVEDPAFAENDEERRLMERRIGFYERCGFGRCCGFSVWQRVLGSLCCMASDPRREEKIPPALSGAVSPSVVIG